MLFLPVPVFLRRGLVGRLRAFAVAVMQRPAAEGRKARAEDHAGVDIVLVLDDAIRRGALGFVEQRLDELAAEPLELGCVVLRLVALRLALLPHIEPLARLLAELALLHERGEDVVGLARGLAVGLSADFSLACGAMSS